MNVFVLCTERCGSRSLSMACKHIKNYTAAHESNAMHIGSRRFNYPSNHIEVDNRLCWLLGRLDNMYGDDAFYVHLTRNTEDVRASIERAFGGGIIKAYRAYGIIITRSSKQTRKTKLENNYPPAVVDDYCHTVQSNISLFLRDKTKKMCFHIENAEDDFRKMCNLIGASVDHDEAVKEFRVKYNAYDETLKDLRGVKKQRASKDLEEARRSKVYKKIMSAENKTFRIKKEVKDRLIKNVKFKIHTLEFDNNISVSKIIHDIVVWVEENDRITKKQKYVLDEWLIGDKT